jgi:hypothetical protein
MDKKLPFDPSLTAKSVLDQALAKLEKPAQANHGQEPRAYNVIPLKRPSAAPRKK